MSDLHTARHLLEVGRPQEALEQLSRLDPVEADDPYALELQAYAHLDLGDPDTAAQDVRRGLAHTPDAIGLRYALSLAEAERGDLAAAEAAILGALASAPDDPHLLTQYARVLLRAGELDKADHVLQAATSAGDADLTLPARIDLAWLRGDHAEAEGLSRLLLADHPDDVRGHTMMGAVAFETGRLRQAESRLGESVRLQPTQDHVADGARAAAIMQRPYYWPVRLFHRYGALRCWAVAIALLLGLRAAGLDVLAGLVGFTWILLCTWSWAAGSRLEHQLR